MCSGESGAAPSPYYWLDIELLRSKYRLHDDYSAGRRCSRLWRRFVKVDFCFTIWPFVMVFWLCRRLSSVLVRCHYPRRLTMSPNSLLDVAFQIASVDLYNLTGLAIVGVDVNCQPDTVEWMRCLVSTPSHHLWRPAILTLSGQEIHYCWNRDSDPRNTTAGNDSGVCICGMRALAIRNGTGTWGLRGFLRHTCSTLKRDAGRQA